MLFCSFHLWTNFKINAVRPSQLWAFSPLHISCCKLTYFATPKSGRKPKYRFRLHPCRREGEMWRNMHIIIVLGSEPKNRKEANDSTQTRKQNVIIHNYHEQYFLRVHRIYIYTVSQKLCRNSEKLIVCVQIKMSTYGNSKTGQKLGKTFTQFCTYSLPIQRWICCQI